MASPRRSRRPRTRVSREWRTQASWPRRAARCACSVRTNSRRIGTRPQTPRLSVWETVHHLVRVLEAGGESAAAELVVQLGTTVEVARELTYRLYTVCERKKWAQEALSYNGLVQSWPEIMRLARKSGQIPTDQPIPFE